MPDLFERLLHGAEVAHPIVDDGDVGMAVFGPFLHDLLPYYYRTCVICVFNAI